MFAFLFNFFGRIHLSRKIQYLENSMYNTPNTEGRIFRSIVHRIITYQHRNVKYNTSKHQTTIRRKQKVENFDVK